MKITEFGQKIFEQIVRGNRKTNADIFFVKHLLCVYIYVYVVLFWHTSTESNSIAATHTTSFFGVEVTAAFQVDHCATKTISPRLLKMGVLKNFSMVG